MVELNSKAEHRIGDRSEEGAEIFRRREDSAVFFEKLAALTGKEAYLKWVYAKVVSIAGRGESVLWPYL